LCLKFDRKCLFDAVISAPPDFSNGFASIFWRRNNWDVDGVKFGNGERINARRGSSLKFGCSTHRAPVDP
jgi:hypothetical protein